MAYQLIPKHLLLAALLGTTGCASNPDSIDAAYVSPLKYAKYDCDQISTELGYVGQRTALLYQNLKEKRQADSWQMGVGLVLFWPALFALEGGDGADAAEYSQLKGDFEALRQAATQKRCAINMVSPDEILASAAEKDKGREGGADLMPAQAQDSAKQSELELKLKELEDLKTRGVITDDEYNKARASALGIN
ncbi:MAG: metal ABC transporter ATP-binding protein [Pseudomonadota bacterium]